MRSGFLNFYRCAFTKVRSADLLLQSRFFQPLSRTFVIISENSTCSLRKDDFGYFKRSWRWVREEAFFQEGSPRYYLFDYLLVLLVVLAALLLVGIAPAHAQSGVGDAPKKYPWLFKDREAEPAAEPTSQKTTGSANLLKDVDQAVKQARKLYLSDDTEAGVRKYLEILDILEASLKDAPPEHDVLLDLEQRAAIYDELALRLLGPVEQDPKPENVDEIFTVLERQRWFRAHVTLKKAGPIRFHDVSAKLLAEETDLLNKLTALHGVADSKENRAAEAAFSQSLKEVRSALAKNAPKYTAFTSGKPPSLADFRSRVLEDDELLLNFSLLADRLVLGVITTEQAMYYQADVSRTEVDSAVFLLQEKLKECTIGEESSFLGHAWKEPSRRLYRRLFGKFPSLPADKSTLFVIPDRSLWFLPFSLLLDNEDNPLGKGRLISLVPSADILSQYRRFRTTAAKTEPRLLAFESMPWISSEQLKNDTQNPKRAAEAAAMGIDKLILSNPVYPKPSEVIIAAQKLFKHFDVFVGPTATFDRFADYNDKTNSLTIAAVPLSVVTTLDLGRRPWLYFSPGKKGNRRYAVTELFGINLRTGLMMAPMAWPEISDQNGPWGEGPTLLALASYYSGQEAVLINYSDPTWGKPDPFLNHLLTTAAQGTSTGKILQSASRDLPAGLDPSFSGKPPRWAGWILMGDPRR